MKGEHGEIETDPEKVANIIAAAFFAVVSGDTNYSQQFIRHKNRVEQQVINFDTGEMKPSNKITMREYEHTLSLTNETNPGADKITCSMMKHAHPALAQIIVKTFNRIYSENKF